MGKQLKVMGIGALLAVGILVVGYVLQQRQLAEVDALVAQCKGEHLNKPAGPLKNWQQAPLVCEPHKLLLAPNRTATQNEIVAASREAYDIADSAIWIAVIIFGLSALPFLWLFLLNRIRELGNAVRGKE